MTSQSDQTQQNQNHQGTETAAGTQGDQQQGQKMGHNSNQTQRSGNAPTTAGQNEEAQDMASQTAGTTHS